MQLPIDITIEWPTRDDLRSPKFWFVVALALAGIAAVAFLVRAALPSPTRAEIASASLAITSAPPGATILIAGRERGRTPATLALPPGEHRVTLRLADHAATTYAVRLAADQTTALAGILWRGTPEAQRIRPPLPGATIAAAQFLADGRVTLAVALPSGDERQLWLIGGDGNARRIGPPLAQVAIAAAPDGSRVAYLARPAAGAPGAASGNGVEGLATEVWVTDRDGERGERRYALPPNTAAELSWPKRSSTLTWRLHAACCLPSFRVGGGLHSGSLTGVPHYRRRSRVILARSLQRLLAATRRAAQALRHRLVVATRPASAALIAGTLADASRSRSGLIAENAFLRQQLIIAQRSVKRPRCTPIERTLLVLLASRVRAWRQALLIVQPETLLRWHRQLFRRYWHRRSRAAAPAHRPPLAPETVALIREMAAANRLWGAERIRGELLKLDIRVARSTIQKYLREARPHRRAGQPWATFLRNHAGAIWACDFLPVTDLLFRPLFAFFIIELATRRVVHVGVTRHPTDAWVAQQLREATPYGERPKYLIRDNDSKFGRAFARVAVASGITELRTAYRTPGQNATCERFLGSVRRECLDHVLVLGEAHLRRVLREYAHYFNRDRPHQGLAQQVPEAPQAGTSPIRPHGGVRAIPILGGLHHAYAKAA